MGSQDDFAGRAPGPGGEGLGGSGRADPPLSGRPLRMRPCWVDPGGVRLRRVGRDEPVREDRLQQREPAKDILMAVSQEMRVPLNTVIGFSDLMLSNSSAHLDADDISFVRHIHEAGIHMLRLVNNLLDLARLDAGRVVLRPVEFDVSEAICSATDALAPLIRDRGIHLLVEEGGVGHVHADPTRFRQILYNLLVVLAGEATRGDVIVLAFTHGEDVLRVEVRAARHGGKAASAGCAEIELALASHLVEAHSGTLEIDEEEGARRFVVSLPQASPGSSPFAPL